MKNRKTNFIILMLSSVLCLNSINKADAQTSVKIGQQEWMINNLNVSKFKNGDTVPEARTNDEWIKAGAEFKPAWCYYNNDPKNDVKYGKLYNIYAVIDPRGLAPVGWHISSDKEWDKLIEYVAEHFLGVTASVERIMENFPNPLGKFMKSKEGWQDNKNGGNESGFTALPGGGRYSKGEFKYMGNKGNWWNSRQAYSLDAWRPDLYDHYPRVFGDDYNEGHGFSVRCIKD